MATLTKTNKAHLLAPAAVMVVVLLMVVPLPALLLDLLLSVDIALAVVLLLTTVYVRQPVEFSVFPSLLLLLTLIRLSLNVASTRLVLMNGHEGVEAAGHVIMAFGQFVVGGNFVVGVVIFLVLIAIQFVVINHGAVRISEVTARFTLDALPGRQMAIDADLNAGVIDEKEARQRRDRVRREADFYGAMDGAIRFTQRDAHGRRAHHRRQHRRRPDHRRAPARAGSGDRGGALHDPDGRRGPRHRDSVAPRLDVGRTHHHARGLRVAPRRGSGHTAAREAPAAGRGRRRADVPGPHSGPAQVLLPQHCGGPRGRRVRGSRRRQAGGRRGSRSGCPLPTAPRRCRLSIRCPSRWDTRSSGSWTRSRAARC